MTAVEWLEIQITKKDCGDLPMYVYNLIEQALEMEKQQIMDAHSNGWSNGIQGNFITTQEYYNETFKSE